MRWMRRCEQLLVLGSAATTPATSTEARTVPLSRIVGTVARCCDFDACFRPLRRHLRERLDRLRRQLPSRPVPPVELREAADGYYVVDGHHRIALARERGQLAIDARIRRAAPPNQEVATP